MSLNATAAALGVVFALTATSSQAGDHQKSTNGKHEAESIMQSVSNNAAVGEPGYRWRYFADPNKHSAVAISPTGDYYYSRGKGLSLIFKGASEQKAS
jgi:hypothetical protein